MDVVLLPNAKSSSPTCPLRGAGCNLVNWSLNMLSWTMTVFPQEAVIPRQRSFMILEVRRSKLNWELEAMDQTPEGPRAYLQSHNWTFYLLLNTDILTVNVTVPEIIYDGWGRKYSDNCLVCFLQCTQALLNRNIIAIPVAQVDDFSGYSRRTGVSKVLITKTRRTPSRQQKGWMWTISQRPVWWVRWHEIIL